MDVARRPFLLPTKKVVNLRSAGIGDRGEKQYKVQKLNDGFYLWVKQSSRAGCVKTYRSCLAFCSRERLSPITDMAYGQEKPSYCSTTQNTQ